jgi:hypothetical protein
MYYLVNLDYNLMATEVTVKVFRKSWLSTVVDGTDDFLWKAVKRMGMLGVSVRRMKVLTGKMEPVTLICEGNMQLRAKYFS